MSARGGCGSGSDEREIRRCRKERWTGARLTANDVDWVCDSCLREESQVLL